MPEVSEKTLRPGGSRVRKKITMEVISPVHIGTREGKITALEFIVHQGKVHLIDETKLGKFLRQRNLIDAFVQEAGRGPMVMDRFLRDAARIDTPTVIPQIASQSVPGGEPDMQDYRPFIRDGMGRVFFPGTSLKGALRTALLYRTVKKNPKINEQITVSVERDLGGTSRLPERQKKRFSEKWLQRDLLQEYLLPNGKKGPDTDILRCLTVRDAYPIGPLKTRIIPIRFLSRRAEGNFYWSQGKGERPGAPKDLGIWVEAVTEGKFSVEIGWDQRLFEIFGNDNPKRLPVSGMEDLLSAAHDMSKDLCSHEGDFFRRKTKLPPGTTVRDLLRVGGLSLSEPESSAGMLSAWYGRNAGPLFRIGFGSGMLSTTVNLALPAELRGKIRDACGHSRPGDPAPKSRRVWRKSETEVLPMGWMKIT
jgi:CRISPR-associated protein Csm5